MTTHGHELLDEPAGGLVLLAHLDDAGWERLIGLTERELFDAGAVVGHAGEVDRSLLLLLSGEIELRRDDEGEPAKVVKGPAVLGEVAFLDGSPRSLSLVAGTEGELLRLGYDDFTQLAEEDPALAFHVVADLGRIVAQRLRFATEAAFLAAESVAP
jgi:CRP/FNR family transcriptional regulator, cyclic AMP receptor protein